MPYLRERAPPRTPTCGPARSMTRWWPSGSPSATRASPGACAPASCARTARRARGVKGRATIEIEHPPGEEIQWDWDELPEAPWGEDAHLLVGSLPCSGKFRGVFAESEDQAHLIEAMDGVLRRLGGNARRWRVDRMATVVDPKTGIVQPSFVPVAKHYGASVVACPPRRGNRKGAVEKSIHFATQRFWRTMTATTIDEAQRQLDRFCERIGDRRPRSIAKLEELVGQGGRRHVPGRARTHASERGRPGRARAAPPAASRLLPGDHRRAQHASGASALVAFEGNAYSVPPGLIGAEVTVRHRLGAAGIEIVSGAGVLLASHYRETPGGGYVRARPGPPGGPRARGAGGLHHGPAVSAERPTGHRARRPGPRRPSCWPGFEDDEVVVSLAAYQSIVDDMATPRVGGPA